MGDKTKNAKVVVEDGAINTMKSATLAKKEVKRDDGVPVHACGMRSYRDCPCWECTSRGCQACMSSMY